MRNLSLVFLMCFNVGLQAGIPHGNPGAAQHYTNTAQGKINSYQASLESDYESLSTLMNNMEIAMCGINADSGGLIVESSGSGNTATYSYSNCNGGAMGYYNSWSNQVNYWANIINTATSNSAWTTGYDACIATYQGPSGYNTDVYSDLNSAEVIGYVNNMAKNINSIVGCTHNANPSSPYNDTTNPDACPVDLPSNLLAVGNTDTSNNQKIGLIQNMITTMDNLSNAINISGLQDQAKTINATWAQYVSFYNAYVTCYNNNHSSWNALKACATIFENYLDSYETEVSAMIALFDALLPLLNDVSGTYAMEPEPASIVCWLAPERCLECDSSGSNCQKGSGSCDLKQSPTPCQYSIGNFTNFDINGTLQKISNYVQSANNTVKNYNSQLVVMKNRLSALINQLQIFNTNVTNVQNQITQINTNCKTDIYEYEANKSNTIFTVIDMIVGAIITIPFISFTGGLGGPALELLTMLLLQQPAINNNTFGAISGIISQDITQAIQNA